MSRTETSPPTSLRGRDQNWRRFVRIFRHRWVRPVLILIAFCIALLMPALGPSLYQLRVATIILIYVPLAVGQNLITGNTGQVSMGHAALYGTGAYITGILTVHLGWPTVSVVMSAVFAGALLGFVASLPSIWVQGDYLFIVSMGLNLIFLDVVTQAVPVTGGNSGLPGVPFPAIGPIQVSDFTGFFYVSLAAAALAVVVAGLVLASRLGKVIEASRDDVIAAEAVGIRAAPLKTAMFALAGGLAGLAGCILAYYLAFVGPQDFAVSVSLIVFQMIIIGGMGSVAGSVLGAVLMIGIPEALRPLQEYRLGIGGALVILMMILRPQGLLGTLRIRR